MNRSRARAGSVRRTLLAALVAVALLAGSSFESARAQGLAAPAATVADF